MSIGDELDKIANREYSAPLEDEPIPMSIWEDAFAKELAKQVAAAEARGWQKATDALRDTELYASWLRVSGEGEGWRSNIRSNNLAADYLDSIANQATPDTPTPQAVRDDHS